MKTAALPVAPIARLREPAGNGPGKRRAAGEGRRVCGDARAAQISGPPGGMVWCVHCYQVLGSARSRRQRLDLERAHHCPEKLLAKVPSSPPPYN